MSAFALILLLFGAVLMLVGGIMLIIAAFRQSMLWGLAYLFIPFAALVFLFRHWSEARRGFLINIVGGAMFSGAIICSPEMRAQVMQSLDEAQKARSGAAQPTPSSAAVDLTARIQEHRDHIDRLNAQLSQSSPQINKQYKDLTAKRAALKPNDQAAIEQFNQAAAAYKAQNEARKKIQTEIGTTQTELEALLAQRSKLSTH